MHFLAKEILTLKKNQLDRTCNFSPGVYKQTDLILHNSKTLNYTKLFRSSKQEETHMFLSAFYLPTTVVGNGDTVKKKKKSVHLFTTQLKRIIPILFVYRYCVEC